MLDTKTLIGNIDDVVTRLRTRQPDIDTIHDRLVKLDQRRKQLIREVEDLKAQQNRASKEIGARKKSGEDAGDILAEMQILSAKIKMLDSELDEAKESLKAEIERLPNIPIDPTPLVADKSGNKVIREWGEAKLPKDWDFQFRNHLEVAEGLGQNGGLDFPTAAKMTGANWAMYRGDLAHLEWALVKFLIDRTRDDDRELIIPPYAVNAASMYASGQFPKFRDQAYECRDDDLVLLPTSEVALLNMYRDEILPDKALPIRLASFTPCFRREAGTYGEKERGLIRIHQFHKVEIFTFTRPDEGQAELEAMTNFAEKLVQDLGLPYRISLLAAGDLAHQAACTYDIEVWLPGQEIFSEVSSVSNCSDYQARRAKIRYRPEGQNKTEFVYTLNGSALATSRIMVSILENYQTSDGGLAIPDVLQPYVGGRELIEPTSRG